MEKDVQQATEVVETEEIQPEEKPNGDPLELFRVGVIELEMPILAQNVPVSELRYDFTKVTNREYLKAMDSDRSNASLSRISQQQAFELFLQAAKRCNPGLDETDIRQRIGLGDMMAGIRVAAGFFVMLGNRAAERIKSRLQQ